MSLRAKLLLAQLPLILALLLVAMLARHTVNRLSDNAQAILRANHASVLAMQNLRNGSDALSLALLQKLHGFSNLAPASLAEKRGQLDAQLRFQASNITEMGEAELTQTATQQLRHFNQAIDAVLAAAPGEQERVYFQNVLPSVERLHVVFGDIIALNQDAMVRKSSIANEVSAELHQQLLLATLLALLLGFASSGYLTTRLTRPLAVLAQAARRVGAGDLAARVRLPSSDEIAAVATEFNAMAEHLAQYRSSSLGELLQAQQAAQATIDSLPDPVLVVSGNGALLNVNQTAELLLNVHAEESLEQLFGRCDPLIRDLVLRMKEQVLSGHGAYLPKSLEESIVVVTSDGTRAFLGRANPVLDEQSAIIGVTILLQDVTKLRRFDELKSNLVATVAHEFRTPLTSLRMAIHLCAETLVGPLNPKQTDLLFAAREDCERLQSIVDDLLDLSRIQAGHIELHQRPTSAASLIAHAIDTCRAQAKSDNIELSVGKLTIDRSVLADPDRVQLVLGNLIANALRHTPAGGRIELRAAPDEQSVRFEVSDNGEGIPQHLQARLFERFCRLPNAKAGGAGLGLYICKEIVEAHGGRVGVVSEEGQGSIFWFTLPVGNSTAANEEAR